MRGLLHVDESGPLQDEICRTGNGFLTEEGGSARATAAPCFLEPNRTYAPPGRTTAPAGLDVFRVGTLLSAAGASMDQESVSLGGEDRTNRFNGLQLKLFVKYRNKDAHWSTKEVPLSYVYTVSAVRNGTFDFSQVRRAAL